MAFRAIVLGLCVAAVLGAFTFFNDLVIRNTQLVGNYLPMSVVGSLVLFVIVVNPLLARLSPRLKFSSRELTVTVAVVFFACCIPGRSLMHLFTNQLMMPHHHAVTDVALKGSTQHVPPRMLADPGEDPDTALKGFVTGLSQGGEDMSLLDIPWWAWRRTLLFWVPLVMALMLAGTGLALVVHRQWLHHESLPYPIAQVTRSLLPSDREDGKSIYHDRRFLLGVAAVLCIHLNNYASRWYPDVLIEIPLRIDISPVAAVMPQLAPYSYLFYPKLYFTAMAFSYFVASDVAFSLGIGTYLFHFIAGTFATYGVVVDGREPEQGAGFFIYAGAYVGMFIMVLYNGRHYFSKVVKRALGFRRAGTVDGRAIWGFRIGMLGAAVFGLQLVCVGLDWQLAVLFTALTLAYHVVVSRITVECGLFFVQGYLMAGYVLWGLIGDSVGLEQLIIMGIVSIPLMNETRELLMPFAVNALAIADRGRIALGRTAAWGFCALALTFAIAVPATLYWQYREGAIACSYGYAAQIWPKVVFIADKAIRDRVVSQGRIDELAALSGWSRFREIHPRREALAGFGIAMALVMILAFMRLRFAKWPLHPIFLLVLGSWPGIAFAPSFLLGWAIRTAIVRYGGASLYQRLKPLMIGLIVGEMLAGLFILVYGGLYFWLTSIPPKAMWIMPG